MKQQQSVKLKKHDVDVILLTALKDELDGVVAVSDGRNTEWMPYQDAHDYQLRYARFQLRGQQEMGVLAAMTGMGVDKAAAWASRLAEKWTPKCIAMSGICAGWREKVAQGDLIVAEKVYNYEHGKLVVDGTAAQISEITTYNLKPQWRQWVEENARSWAREIAIERPLTLDSQELWFVATLFNHETTGSPSPHQAPDRSTSCPDFVKVRARLEAGGEIGLGSQLCLTETGKERARRYQQDYPEGVIREPFAVKLGSLATGNRVVQDRDIFKRLSTSGVRSVHGLEMEAASIGMACDIHGTDHFVAKAVQDFADEEKDDRFREFACRVSAEFTLFSLRNLISKPRRTRAKSPPTVTTEGEQSSKTPLITAIPISDVWNNQRAVLDGLLRVLGGQCGLMVIAVPHPEITIPLVALDDLSIKVAKTIGATFQGYWPIGQYTPENVTRGQQGVEYNYRMKSRYNDDDILNYWKLSPNGVFSTALMRLRTGVDAGGYTEWSLAIDTLAIRLRQIGIYLDCLSRQAREVSLVNETVNWDVGISLERIADLGIGFEHGGARTRERIGQEHSPFRKIVRHPGFRVAEIIGELLWLAGADKYNVFEQRVNEIESEYQIIAAPAVDSNDIGRKQLREWGLSKGSRLLKTRIKEDVNWEDLARSQYAISRLTDVGFPGNLVVGALDERRRSPEAPEPNHQQLLARRGYREKLKGYEDIEVDVYSWLDEKAQVATGVVAKVTALDGHPVYLQLGQYTLFDPGET